MDLTVAAIDRLAALGVRPDERIVELEDGRLFGVDQAGNVSEIFERSVIARYALEINTLSGFVNYIKSNIERVEKPMLVHIKNETTVYLRGSLEIDGERETLAKAKAIVPSFDFGYFLDMESFNIALQSKFVPSDHRAILLQVIGNVSEDNIRQTGDDGVSQAVTINQGIATKADVRVPNPVDLAPYRTFLEVEQPTSQFIFRMKDGPRGAIFEADGGAWRNQAIVNIREYLKEQLSEEIDSGRITIIA